jgi:signal transduction histidine kinase
MHAAAGGTVRMKGGRVHVVPGLAVTGEDRKLVAACEDASGLVWLYNANGEVWRVTADGAQATPHFAPDESAPGTPLTIMQEVNGPVWIATSRAQYAMEGAAPADQLPLPITTTLRAPIDLLVTSARGGYWRLIFPNEIQRWITNRLEQRVATYQWPFRPKSACEDREGSLVVGTEGGGIHWISPEGATHSLTTRDGLSHDFVRSVLVDREGILWVGTDGGGLNRVKRQSFRVLPGTETLAVQTVAEDRDGGLWFGAARGGLAYARTGSVQFVSVLGSYIPAVFVDRAGSVWTSSDTVNLLRGANLRFQRVPGTALLPSPAKIIHQDRTGTLWFGSQDGLLRYDQKDWQLFTTTNGLSSHHITALADDVASNMWIGTRRGGLLWLRDGKFTAFRKADGAPSDDINGLFADEQGVLWVTTPAGLGRWQDGRWTRYSLREGLLTERLGYLLEDGAQNLWIGSDRGVLRLSKAALNDFAAGKTAFIPCRAYDKEDGLISSSCTMNSQPGAWRGHDGTLWFATQKGLASVNPAQLRPNTNQPAVNIDALRVDDAPVGDRFSQGEHGRTLTLRPRDERLQIHYSSLNLGAPDRVRFRFKLDNYDKDWAESVTNVARYQKLPVGEYEFHVSAANEDGVWNERGSTLAIIVQPPYWRTWWFIAGSAVGLFGLVAGIVHFVSTQKLQRQLILLREKEALEKERARIARDIHDQVGASLTQVALLGELVQVDRDSPPDVLEHAQQIQQTARETTRALDEIVWTVNPQNDTLEGLVNYICKYAQDYLAVADVSYRFDVPPQMPPRAVAPEVRHNVFLASKEAVTNIVRHSKATAAWIRVRVEPAAVVLEIEDNGRGVADLDLNAPRTRHGLKNMRKRLEDIGGTFTLTPGAEGGALARFTFPLT